MTPSASLVSWSIGGVTTKVDRLARAACPGGISPCFTEETTVDAGGIEKPIAEVRLGDRAGPELAACADPALATWREVGLRMRVVGGGDKDELEIRLLQPESWLEAHQVAAGRIIEIELEELSVRGKALVTSVGAPGHVAPGTRCPVTGWVKHTSSDVIELGLDGLDASLRVTRHHRIYSADREGWVAAGDLQAGERLTTMHGTTQVAWLSPNALPSVDVYNLEVIGAEQYYVTAQRVLVHNDYFEAGSGTLVNRIGGGAVENLRLKPAEVGLNPPGISVLLDVDAARAATQMLDAFPMATRIHEAARIVGHSTVDRIRAAGFDGRTGAGERRRRSAAAEYSPRDRSGDRAAL